MGSPKKLSRYNPWAKDQGVDHVVAAGKAGVGLQSKRLTQTATPTIVNFAAQELSDMEDGTYDVIIQSPSVSTASIDYANRKPTGFEILNSVNGDACTVIIVGRLKGQAA